MTRQANPERGAHGHRDLGRKPALGPLLPETSVRIGPRDRGDRSVAYVLILNASFSRDSAKLSITSASIHRRSDRRVGYFAVVYRGLCGSLHRQQDGPHWDHLAKVAG